MSKNLFNWVLSLILCLSLLFSSCSIVNKLQGNNVATVASNGIYVSPGVFTPWDYAIFVDLKPTQSAIAGETYAVDLYEKSTFRATTTVSFTQPNINIGATEKVAFPATADEDNAYFGKIISNIFSVKVHAPTTTTNSIKIDPDKAATITLKYPNGGEVWHVGETVNITWTTTNLKKDATIYIDLYNNYGNDLAFLFIPDSVNNGSYKWKVTSELQGKSTIGSHSRIQLECNLGTGTILKSVSAA